MVVTAWDNAAVAVCDSSSEAAGAVASLRQAGFDTARISVAGRSEGAAYQVVGCFDNGGSGVKYWGDQREFWARLWGALPGWALFTMPGVGPVLVAGPLSGWIAAGLENAPVFGGLGALGAAVYSIGVPKRQSESYEAAVKAGKFLVLAHGSVSEVNRASEAMASGQGQLTGQAPLTLC